MVLVGASGGYTLPWATLHEIPDKIFIEPDPLARLCLRRRDSRARIDARPALGWSEQGYSAQELRRWLDRHRGDALLFCNLLGQLDERQTLAASEWRSSLLDHLRGHAWLSYHDLFSAALAPCIRGLAQGIPSRRTGGESPIVDEAFWAKLYPYRDSPIEVVDHGTALFFARSALQADAHQYFAWPLDSTRWHLIEGLASATPGRGRADPAVPRRASE